MNYRFVSRWWAAAPLILAVLRGMGAVGQTVEVAGVAGTVPAAAGSSSVRFEFPAPKLAGVLVQKRYRRVDFPAGMKPLALGDNGAILFVDYGNGFRVKVRWQDDRWEEIDPGVLTKRGDLVFKGPDQSYVLRKEDGTITPLALEHAAFPMTLVADFSAGFAVGQAVTQVIDDRPVRGVPVKWNLSGGYQALGPEASLDFSLFQPCRVNDRGDYFAWQFAGDAMESRMTGTYLNDQFFPGYEGSYLNNCGSAVFRTIPDNREGLPYYWDGTFHRIGTERGLPIALNDRDEMIVLQEDGRWIHWQKTAGADGQAAFSSTDLNSLTGLEVVNVAGINNRGEILVETWPFGTEFIPQGCLLVPVEDRLGVDFNRDGVIDASSASDNPDRELERRGLPWYFWVNDDDDTGETEGTDIPGRGANGQDGVVNGVRDLVDFFPVHLNIAGLLKSYPANDPAVSYRLAQAEGAANFLITDLTPATAGDFQRNVAVSGTLANAPVTQITAGGVALDRAFLGKITTEGKGIILVEARRPSDKPLLLQVWRGETRLAEIALSLSFAGVETMFRHRNITAAVHVTPETVDRQGTPNWADELNNGQAFVFLHGYNVNQQQARGWQAEFFKRLWWSGSRAQFWGVTWYGSESQLPVAGFTPNYQVNVIHAFGQAGEFAKLVAELHESGITDINVAGHSLGNMVISSAISDYRAPVTRYFLIDAAVAAEAYDANEAQPDDSMAFMPHSEWNRERGGVYPPRLWPNNWYKLFQGVPGDGRSRLSWRGRFAPRTETDYFDFHSTGEEVLGYDSKNTPSLVGVLARELAAFLQVTLPGAEAQPNGYKAWVYQEQLKGRTITGKILGSSYGGWGFNVFHFKKQPVGGGKGPAMIPSVLSPLEAAALSPQLSDADLQSEPFFRPGANRIKVGTWLPDINGNGNLVTDPLGALFGPNGSAFAFTHRDTLLARMVPATSPPAGRVPVSKFGQIGINNFDMSNAAIRGFGEPWISGRPNKNWRHSDARVVAYTYVRGLFEKIVGIGGLARTP